MNLTSTRTLSVSVFALLLPLVACQQTQDLEGNGQAAATGTASDGGTSSTDDGGTTPDGSTSSGPSKILLFGGSNASGLLADTWEWDGSSWTQKSASGGPSARSGSAGALIGSSIFLYGGNDATAAQADTWRWDGNGWTQVSVTGPRASSQIFGSSTGSSMIVFGPIAAPGSDQDPQTWTFDGTTWTQQNPAIAPGTTVGYSITSYKGQVGLFDSGGFSFWNGSLWNGVPTPSGGPSEEGNAGLTESNGKVVLFGGEGQDFNALDETWTWDGTNWTLQNVTDKPSGRIDPGMATMKDGTVVLFGGCGTGFGEPSSDLCTDDSTWTWDGSSWTEHKVAGPSARAPGIMVAE